MNLVLRDDLAAMIAEEIGACGIKPQKRPEPASALSRSWQWYDHNDSVLSLVVEQTPRARALRRIATIVDAKGWTRGVTRALDRHGVSRLEDLSDEALEHLQEQMEAFVLSSQTGCEDPDAFIAR